MRFASRVIHVLLIVLIAGTAPAAAQARDGLKVGFKTPVQPAGALVGGGKAYRASRTYWREGGFITGIPAAIAFNILYGDEDHASMFGRVLGTALVGLVFAVPGMVIGGLFPKE